MDEAGELIFHRLNLTIQILQLTHGACIVPDWLNITSNVIKSSQLFACQTECTMSNFNSCLLNYSLSLPKFRPTAT